MSSFETAIRGWLQATDGEHVQTGMSVDEAMLHAEELLTVLPAVTSGWSVAPDVLHAIGRALENGSSLEKITWAYELVDRLPWPADEFSERDELLAKLAYLAWSNRRMQADLASMELWKGRCVEGVLAQGIVRNFLAIPFADRSPALNRRFLDEPTTVLAITAQLAIDRNRLPAYAAKEATFVYDWLTEAGAGIAFDDNRHIAAEVAISAAVATTHLGMLRKSAEWLSLAEEHFANTQSGRAFLPQVEFMRLRMAYIRHELRDVVERVPAVIADLERIGPAPVLRRCRFLEAVCLKDVGQSDQALFRLEQLKADLEKREDPLLFGLVLMVIGEIVAKEGNPEAAMSYLRDANELLRIANTSWALADLQGVKGEVLRDQGQLPEAIEAYRAAVAMYSELAMEVHTAYLRLILAETLIASGRNVEATAEILTALPVFEREGVVPDAVAGVALLNNSLRRGAANPNVLRRLREHLDQMRKGEQA